MITPDNQVPLDDSDESENDDQQSQKDVHSNGLDDFAEDTAGDQDTDPDQLKQAYDASEASYTLDAGDDEDK